VLRPHPYGETGTAGLFLFGSAEEVASPANWRGWHIVQLSRSPSRVLPEGLEFAAQTLARTHSRCASRLVGRDGKLRDLMSSEIRSVDNCTATWGQKQTGAVRVEDSAASGHTSICSGLVHDRTSGRLDQVSRRVWRIGVCPP